jgi:D-alanine-D-alanine ligase
MIALNLEGVLNLMINEVLDPSKKGKNGNKKMPSFRTLGPVADLEKHLPEEWWKTLFNSLYLKTDGDVVENNVNTEREVDLIIDITGINKQSHILDLCCGQGRHSLELARRGFGNVTGIDRSRYLVRLARKRARKLGLQVHFSEGDARKIRLPESSQDCVYLMGNSFGYFEKEEDDLVVIKAVKHVLNSKGKLLLDLVDGQWMKENYDPRSWEWIDQNHFVCRERTLSSDCKRIVSREVVVNAEVGIIADQFYAERLYSFEEIAETLAFMGYEDIILHGNLVADSTRAQDLGMMANRLIISAVAPVKKVCKLIDKGVLPVTVLMGDPHLPDNVKRNGVFNKEDMETINKLRKSLKTLNNFKFSYLSDHKNLLQSLLKDPPSFVFNLCDEGYNNNARHELHVPALLDILGVPYTGASPASLAICYNKSIVRAVAMSLDIPVPLETYFSPSDQVVTLPSIFPAIMKPNFGDGSIGITKDAVVNNAEELIAYLNSLRETMPSTPVLVQEYLQGTEYSIGIIGNPGRFDFLPVLEVDYTNLPEALPKILSYESKFFPESPYWTDIIYKEAELDEATCRKLMIYSSQLFERLGCKDYARIDFRKDQEGTIKLLEVNPNPGWCWDGKMNYMASFKGIEYSELLEMILNATKERLNM